MPEPIKSSTPETGEKTGYQATVSPVTTSVELPGLEQAPAGTLETYRQMLGDPTIALVRAVTMSPIVAGTWSFVAQEGAPDEWVEFIEGQLESMRSHIVTAAIRYLDFGWAGFEKVFDFRDGKIILRKLKPLLHDITNIRIEKDTGQFAGFKQHDASGQKIELPVEKSLLFTNDREGDNYYGRARLENLRETWSWWRQANNGAARYDRKIAGVMPVVHYPPGKSTDKSGVQRDNYEIASLLLGSIAAGKGIAAPNDYQKALDESDGPERRQWIIELLEDKGGRQPTFSDRLRYLDSQKFRGYLRPERSALEGQSGTKAEAETHGDLGLTDGELIHHDIVRTLNWHVIDQLLVLNFGEVARGAVHIVPAPLRDSTTAMAAELIKEWAKSPDGREDLRLHLDFDTIMDLAKVPIINNPSTPRNTDELTEGVDPSDPQAQQVRDLMSRIQRG